MKRRAPRRQTDGQSGPPTHPANHSRAYSCGWMAQGIRKKIKKDYEREPCRDLENSQRQLDQFQQTDLPQFTRWI